MQKEIPIPGHEFPTVLAPPWIFADEYNFATSLHHPYFLRYYSPFLGNNYLNDAGFDYHSYDAGFSYNLNDAGFSYDLNDAGLDYDFYDSGFDYDFYDAGLDYNLYDAGWCYNWGGAVCESSMAWYWREIHYQQLLLHQALMYRHQTIISHLREVANQEQTLRHENANLKTANRHLNNRVKMLIKTTSSAHGVGLGSGLDGLRKTGAGADEEGTSVKDAVAKSPTPASMTDPIRVGLERVELPKSISVRSPDFRKAGKRRASNPNKIDNGTQKVYVNLKGSENENEEAVEVEVYEQGMFKTELCQKWQQTGSCPYGENCRFAHGIEELRPIIRHPRYKTDLCLMLANKSHCPYDHRCHFRHALTDEEKQLLRAPMNPPMPIEPMKYC